MGKLTINHLLSPCPPCACDEADDGACFNRAFTTTATDRALHNNNNIE